MDILDLERKLGIENMSADEQMALLTALQKSAEEKAAKAREETIGKSAELVIQGLKRIKTDLESRFADLNSSIQDRVSNLRNGIDGKDGRDGKDGKSGRDGLKGDKGDAGRDGRDGVDGADGVSVTDARIDFDGSLIIVLSTGRELNVGEVVAPDLAERIKVITNGGGTSQSVLDSIASLQTQINNLIPSQTGNSGKFLTTNGTTLSWGSAVGGLSYQGTWNASTNSPTLASGVGTNGYYYVVGTAGSTNLDGITSWNIGDWLIFNGSTWQKIDQSETLQFVTSADSSVTVTTTGATADLAVYSSPRLIAQVRNETGATLAKGTVVYINGAAGNKATVTKAIATGDSTSAQTFGLVFADISHNNNGYAILAGDIAGLDTSAFTAGQQLYLSSTTAGAYTSTKQYAPNHLVYIGVVTRSHVNQGSIEVRIQNGYEMDELHNVSAQSPSNGQVLIYNESTSLWEKANISGTASQVTVTNGAGSIALSLPSTINVNTSGSAATLTTGRTISISGDLTYTSPSFNGSANVTAAGTLATVNANVGSFTNASVTVNAKGLVTAASNGTAPVTSVTATSPVASSGGTTPAISLSAGYGDTLNPYASKTANYVLASPNGSAGVPTFRALVAADVPTLNQNTTGTAASTPKLLTTNFTIEESGGKLLFKYGATTIASMSSTGIITSATNIVANGTP